MLGYELKDLDEMIYAIQSVITTVDSNDDPFTRELMESTGVSTRTMGRGLL
jgi:hypothetical protein